MKNTHRTYRPLLSILLCLALALCLVPLMTLPGSALSNLPITATMANIQYYPSGCLQSVDITAQLTSGGFRDAHGRFAVHEGDTTHDYLDPVSYDSSAWPTNVTDSTFVAFGSGSEFLWTDMQPHSTTISFADGEVPMNANKDYTIVMWSRCDGYGVYPDFLVGNLKVANNQLSFQDSTGRTEAAPAGPAGSAAPAAPVHVHHWVVTGHNTDTLTAKCTGAGTCEKSAVSVSIAAKSVTLPDTPYNAQITGADAFQSVTGLKVQPLADKGRAAYKYKAMGADSFTDPDLNAPKAGTYQAILYVTDDDGVTSSAFAEYTAIDPVKTAATGDTRPVEIIALGLGMFCAMAAVSFTLDRKMRG